jgi:MFS family permease
VTEADNRREPWLMRIGLFPPLFWGFVGTLLFMIGDGVEAGYLSPYLQSRHISQSSIALLFTTYGFAAAFSAWLSGALADILGPKRVMWMGLGLWTVFEVLFLLFGIGPNDYLMMLVTYGIRGFAYPLFAYGFLIWVTAATPAKHLGAAVGWFWFAFTGGLCFNPRAHVGRDEEMSLLSPVPVSFNPRAHMGRDAALIGADGPSIAVSIHAPTWGATACR